jgi:tetratricopeptide (TPR) repeat protein
MKEKNSTIFNPPHLNRGGLRWGYKSLGLILLLFPLVFLNGCNIFNFFHKAGSNTDDPDILISDAESSLVKGDYEKAMDYYERVVQIEPANSKARYGYVNAYMKSANVNILVDFPKNTESTASRAMSFNRTIAFSRSITNFAPGMFSFALSKSSKSYFLLDNYGIDIRKFENLAIIVIEYLDPIAKGECDGKIKENDTEINLNLAFAYLLRGVFLVADPPNGKSGVLKYNIKCKDDGSYSIWSYITNSEVSIDTIIQKKSDVLNNLDTAIIRLDTAISNSPSKYSSNWDEVKKVLENVKTKISSYKG